MGECRRLYFFVGFANFAILRVNFAKDGLRLVILTRKDGAAAIILE
jgi:hypothetical protein